MSYRNVYTRSRDRFALSPYVIMVFVHSVLLLIGYYYFPGVSESTVVTTTMVVSAGFVLLVTVGLVLYLYGMLAPPSFWCEASSTSLSWGTNHRTLGRYTRDQISVVDLTPFPRELLIFLKSGEVIRINDPRKFFGPPKSIVDGLTAEGYKVKGILFGQG